MEWNDTSADYPGALCAHELFEAQAARSPNGIAVVFEDEQLTYGELNQRANQLACRLQSSGVGPEVRVGICMERSLTMVVGVLATLKAGGAYVPIDPTFPKERLAFMIEDSQLAVLLSQEGLAANLPTHGVPVIYPDLDPEATAKESTDNPASGVTGENLAYVIYTSGSTGRPKAVAMGYSALSNLVAWQLKNLRQPLPARTLQFASLSFDVSFQEIFCTWCCGGTLILIPEELRRDRVGLLRFVQENSVERLLLSFVALQQLAEAVSEQGVVAASLREIITAGEQLQITPQIMNWFSRLKDCALRNQYGPSESHVVTAFTLEGAPMDWPALPPIGRPIANTHVYLLDPLLNIVPIGITAELYIGGECLARGYLNRPDLTAEKFIPNPFSNKPGARLYKTGDLARYLPDGNIEFQGRIDHQVKIRGFRIELGEIETVLGQHPAVRETVVLTREDTPGEKRLVAYVVPHRDFSPSAGELRSFLKEKLPEYMVPSAFVVLASLPLTPSGKVNRKALPAPDRSRPEQETPFVAPSTPEQKRIAEIWAQVLTVDRVGIHDNF
ncbi:MAG: non-ribosomal peptide synthetase, partial [Candidatus Binatia bacterium]